MMGVAWKNGNGGMAASSSFAASFLRKDGSQMHRSCGSANVSVHDDHCSVHWEAENSDDYVSCDGYKMRKTMFYNEFAVELFRPGCGKQFLVFSSVADRDSFVCLSQAKPVRPYVRPLRVSPVSPWSRSFSEVTADEFAIVARVDPVGCGILGMDVADREFAWNVYVALWGSDHPEKAIKKYVTESTNVSRKRVRGVLSKLEEIFRATTASGETLSKLRVLQRAYDSYCASVVCDEDYVDYNSKVMVRPSAQKKTTVVGCVSRVCFLASCPLCHRLFLLRVQALCDSSCLSRGGAPCSLPVSFVERSAYFDETHLSGGLVPAWILPSARAPAPNSRADLNVDDAIQSTFVDMQMDSLSFEDDFGVSFACTGRPSKRPRRSVNEAGPCIDGSVLSYALSSPRPCLREVNMNKRLHRINYWSSYRLEANI